MSGREVGDRVIGEAAFEERIAAAAELSRQDPSSAERELESIRDAARAAGCEASVPSADYALARVLVSTGRANEALAHIEAAEAAWRALGDVESALRTNLGRMHVLDDLGRHREAADVGGRLLDELEERGNDQEIVWLRAAAEENLGVALGYLGRHSEALSAYETSAASYRDLGLIDDSARASANRGVELIELARPLAAVPALEQALAHFETSEDQLWQGLCNTDLAQAWRSAGRYLDAFRALDAAAEALQGLDHTTDWLRAQIGRAECLASLNLDADALDLYDDLLAPLAAADLDHDLGLVHLGRAKIHARRGAREEASAALGQAERLLEAAGDSAMVARACLVAAEIAGARPETTERALSLLAGAERPAERAAALLAVCQHTEADDPDRAATALLEARLLAERLGVPELQWRVHHHTGRQLRRAGDPEAARREFEAALSVLDRVRGSVDRDVYKLRFDGGAREPADDLLALLLDGGEAKAAFQRAESMRSRGLLERMINPSSSGPSPGVAELNSVYDRLLTARGPLVEELTARARRLERTVVSADEQAATGPVAADASLPPRTVVYQSLGDEVVAFLDSDGAVGARRKLCDLADVQHLLGRLDVQWRRFEHPDVARRHGRQLELAAEGLLRELHDLLVEPIADLLPPSGPLTIVPDGQIGAVPFAALHDGAAPLVERFTIRLTPSLLVDSATAPDRPTGSALVLGTHDALAPNASVEAAHVGACWPRAAVHIGEAATAERLYDEVDDHGVIHVAGHGLFRPDAPEFSALRLADRWITAAEIAQLDLRGQLVIVSACDSGSRRAVRGLREVVGLPRALLAAGGSGVVVNLWPADDAVTADLMIAVHRALAERTDAAAALRRAQLQIRECNPHPYYWASAVLIGCRPRAHGSTS